MEGHKHSSITPLTTSIFVDTNEEGTPEMGVFVTWERAWLAAKAYHLIVVDVAPKLSTCVQRCTGWYPRRATYNPSEDPYSWLPMLDF
jgi:hypothetical protein